jgi:hypothetical protein
MINMLLFLASKINVKMKINASATLGNDKSGSAIEVTFSKNIT